MILIPTQTNHSLLSKIQFYLFGIILHTFKITNALKILNFLPCLPSHSIFLRNHCVGCTYLQDSQTDQLCDTFIPIPTTMGSEKIQTTRNRLQFLHSSTNSSCMEAFACLANQLHIKALNVHNGVTFLSGRELRVVTIERSPFTKTKNKSYSGVIFELLNAMAVKYNFSMNIFLPPDGSWGSKSKANGIWNGMIGLIRRNDADLGGASFSITMERAEAVDFTVAFHQEPSAILIPPPTEGEKLSVIIRPLSSEVWLSICITICVIAPSLYILHILSLKIRGEDEEFTRSTLSSIIGKLFNFLVGSLVQEGLISPTNKTTRFLLGLWWLTTLVIANIYVAFLVSYLSMPKLYNIVDTLDGLTKQRIVKWTFRKNAALQDLFQSGTSVGVYKSVGDAVSVDDLVESDYAGVTQVLTGKFAFIKEKSFLDVALDDDYNLTKQCRFTLAKETFFSVGVALAVQKKSIILELLNHEILNGISTGVMEKWKALHWPQDLWCSDAATFLVATRPKTKKLSLWDMQGAYFLWTCGLIAAAFGYVLELVLRMMKKRYERSVLIRTKGVVKQLIM